MRYLFLNVLRGKKSLALYAVILTSLSSYMFVSVPITEQKFGAFQQHLTNILGELKVTTLLFGFVFYIIHASVSFATITTMVLDGRVK